MLYITVNQDVVAYEYVDGCLRLMVDIPPGRTADIRCAKGRMLSRIQNRSHTDLGWRFGDTYPNGYCDLFRFHV
jgi:hypothetical protein